MAMEFERGDRVEVCGTQEGFMGSYYEATVISRISADEFIVEYETLVSDDKRAPLREIVAGCDVRPRPPMEEVGELASKEEVDAWDNDGWWRGKVVNRWLACSRYKVHFPETDDHKCYSLSDLRVHRDWVDGHWVKRLHKFN